MYISVCKRKYYYVNLQVSDVRGGTPFQVSELGAWIPTCIITIHVTYGL